MSERRGFRLDRHRHHRQSRRLNHHPPSSRERAGAPATSWRHPAPYSTRMAACCGLGDAHGGSFRRLTCGWPGAPHASALASRAFVLGAERSRPWCGTRMRSRPDSEASNTLDQSMGRSGGGLASLGPEANDELRVAPCSFSTATREAVDQINCPDTAHRPPQRHRGVRPLRGPRQRIVQRRGRDRRTGRRCARSRRTVRRRDRLRRRYLSNGARMRSILRGRAALLRYTRRDPRGPSVRSARALLDRHARSRASLAMACAEMYLRFARADEVGEMGERTETGRAASTSTPIGRSHLARPPSLRGSASSTGVRR